VLFECLRGPTAFEAPNLIALLARITLAPIEPLRALRQDLPEALEQLVSALPAWLREATRPGRHAIELPVPRWSSLL